MKVLRFYDCGDVRLEEAPVPAIGPGDILVRTAACGVCSGEAMTWYMRAKARGAPLVLGHEPAGLVEAVGPEVEGFRPGERVFAHHHAPCHVCRDCQRGAYAMCAAWRRSHIDPGGMAEFFRVPAANLSDTLRLPETLSFEDGTLIEPAACAVKALRRARIQQGDTVLVIGLGVMGQMLAKLARHFGAGRVLGADFVPARRAMALRLGADAALDPAVGDLPAQVAHLAAGRGADVVIVGPPTIDAMRSGIACAGRGGTVVLFSPAPPGEMLAVEPHRVYFDEVSIVPSYSSGPDDTRAALRLIEAGALRAADVVTHRYRLAEAPRAYRDMARGGEVVKAMVVFDV